MLTRSGARAGEERRAILQERSNAVPQRVRARERQTFLREVLAQRTIIINTLMGMPGGPGDGAVVRQPDGQPALPRCLARTLEPAKAAALLGMPADAVLLPEVRMQTDVLDYDSDHPGSDVVTVTEPYTADVIYLLLQRAPREHVRKLLRDLGAVVLVQRPRPRFEWAIHGPTRVEDHVSLRLLDAVEVRRDAANVNSSLLPK